MSQRKPQSKSIGKVKKRRKPECQTLRAIAASVADHTRILHELAKIAAPCEPGDDDFSREGYLTHCFLSKFADPGKENADLRRDKAIEKLLLTDGRNAETHERLRKPGNISGIHTDRLFTTASRFIAGVIGDFDYSIFALSEFSNGASTSRRRSEASLVEKFNGTGDVTARAEKYARAYLSVCNSLNESYAEASELLKADPIRVVPGNETFTVEKDDDIDRAAAKEPDFNIFLQRACGKHIRECLLTVGINLRNQGRNQELALEGSTFGELATLDLSSASDSISWGLVQRLFSNDWFTVLSDLRSERGLVNGEWHEWSLMSTMGNGYTFELETLIFWGLARAVQYHFGTPGTLCVYGDDIIAPVTMVEPLIEFYTYCGFIVNPTKSFWTGTFRESCGKHYFGSIDVTPFYCRSPLDSAYRLIWFLNQLRSWAAVGGVCDPRYEDLYFKIRSLLAPSIRASVKGGLDMNSDTELVTPDYHGSYLHRITRLGERRQRPGLTAWLVKTLLRDPRTSYQRARSPAITRVATDSFGFAWMYRDTSGPRIYVKSGPVNSPIKWRGYDEPNFHEAELRENEYTVVTEYSYLTGGVVMRPVRTSYRTQFSHVTVPVWLREIDTKPTV